MAAVCLKIKSKIYPYKNYDYNWQVYKKNKVQNLRAKRQMSF